MQMSAQAGFYNVKPNIYGGIAWDFVLFKNEIFIIATRRESGRKHFVHPSSCINSAYNAPKPK